MAEQTQSKVPEIRFSGFDGEWEEKALEEVFGYLPNNTLSRADLNYSSGIAKNVHYGDILVRFSEILDVKHERLPYITNGDSIKNLKAAKLKDGDIIFADAAEDHTVGKCTEVINIGDDTVLSGLHTIAVRPTKHYASLYFGYFLNSPAYHDQLIQIMQGTKVLSISKTALKQTLVTSPSKTDEQTLIGQHFAKLDAMISQHQRKHAKLVALKKAMLQKMFPRDGATTPEIRFKGFSGDWEEKALGEIAEIIGGGTPSTATPEYWDGDIDWYSPTEIGNSNYAIGSKRKITKLGLNKCSARILPAERTVLFTSRAGIGDMAILKRNGATNQGFQSLVLNEGIDAYFIYTLGFKIKSYALTNASGSTFLEISGKQLGRMGMLIPCENEQKTIGNYFRELDELTERHSTQINKLRNIKAACLEKMFV